MCGRFALYSSVDEIRQAFSVQQVEMDLKSSYNVAPTQQVAVVVNKDGVNHLQPMVWGLIPVWAKDASIGSKMINARAETLAQKPSFKRPLATQRCLVVANGFFEWQKTGPSRIPMFVRLRSGGPLGLAGLYDVWTSPSGEKITSCTIITTDANELVQSIHNRMPVILPQPEYQMWLDPRPKPPSELLPLLRPYMAQDLEAYPVSRLVNSPANNVPECVESLAE
jgi:putative SOS response-associated peptidase YedK